MVFPYHFCRWVPLVSPIRYHFHKLLLGNDWELFFFFLVFQIKEISYLIFIFRFKIELCVRLALFVHLGEFAGVEDLALFLRLVHFSSVELHAPQLILKCP
jgi:hypothetical protein